MSDAHIVITKLDAAKRQLRTAITLWFQDGDPVAIHTLVAAAHEIVHTLFRRRGLSGLLFDSPLIREEYRSSLARKIKEAPTFFKHAQRDPDATLEFNPAVDDSLLMFVTYGLHLMGEPQEAPEATLMLWLMLHEPGLFVRNLLAERVQVEQLDGFRRLSKQQLFELSKLGFGEGMPTHAEIIRAMGGNSSNS